MNEANGNGRRFQINPGPLEIVPAARREAWQQLAREVELDVPSHFRKKWTRPDTARVILAEPQETYEEVGDEINRTPGAVRYRRQAMVHLLKDEHGAQERVEAYRSDPKAHHKHHDYFQVDGLLRELGIYDLPASQQFELAEPLRQPNASWRGDGLSAALGGSGVRALRSEFRRIMVEIRTAQHEAREEEVS